MNQHRPSVFLDLLLNAYPDVEETSQIVISSLPCRFFTPSSVQLLERYTNLKVFVLTRCDLRNLERFPCLPALEQLDLSHNRLQGTFNNLMRLSRLTYIDLTNNLISEVTQLQPLRKLQGITICVKDNPLLKSDSWKTKFQHYGIKHVKEAKIIAQPAARNSKNECKVEQEKDFQQYEVIQGGVKQQQNSIKLPPKIPIKNKQDILYTIMVNPLQNSENDEWVQSQLSVSRAFHQPKRSRQFQELILQAGMDQPIPRFSENRSPFFHGSFLPNQEARPNNFTTSNTSQNQWNKLNPSSQLFAEPKNFQGKEDSDYSSQKGNDQHFEIDQNLSQEEQLISFSENESIEQELNGVESESDSDSNSY